MGLFITSALSEDTIAAPGNKLNNYITVSVSDFNGVPTTGLNAKNFKVNAMIVGPGGAQVNITSVGAGVLPGFYLVNVVPIGSNTWKPGVYIFAIAVKRNADQGQCLAKVLLD